VRDFDLESVHVRWLVGFLLGLVGGFAVGYLAAPAAGADLRRAVSRRKAASAPAAPAGTCQEAAGQRKALAGLAFDERLTRAIREQLLAGDLAAHIDVTTIDGVVYLRGRPRDAGEAARIVAIAERTPGVRSVVNELKPATDVPAG
jgi:osmotically-inducible protein OsmY